MRRIVLDANLLLLLVVGQADRKLIRQQRRLAPKYTVAHFDLLLNLLGGADRLIVTPHSLTEVSNLLGERNDDATRASVIALATALASWVEVFHEAAGLVREPEFAWLGLSDVAQLRACVEGATLLTADGKLSAAAQSRRLPTLNFWHECERVGLA